MEECGHCRTLWCSADLVCAQCGLVLDTAIGEPGETLLGVRDERRTSRTNLRAELREVAQDMGVDLPQSAIMTISNYAEVTSLPRRHVAVVMLYQHLREVPITYMMRRLGMKPSDLGRVICLMGGAPNDSTALSLISRLRGADYPYLCATSAKLQ